MTRTTTATKTLTGREYLRVSKDASGRERSNEEQHDDNAAGCDTEGIAIVGTPYRDQARASRSSTARRLDFEALLDDLRGDRFDADVLIMWESSRGSRRVGEWCTLLDLLEDRSKLVYVTTHHRLYDPTSPRDRRTLLEDAVDAEYESGKSGLRISRSMRANAAAGKRHGGRRAFGYEATGDGIVEHEAEIIREAVSRVLAGDSVRAIAADLNRRGVPTSAGNEWHPGPLSKMLTGKRIVGVRTHKGVVVNTSAQWPAIIDEPTHRRVCATLAARTPTGRRGRTPWVLTGFLRCGRCGATLVGNTDARTGTRRYICRKAPGYNGCGGLGIKAAPLEEVLGDMCVERLADVEARRAARTLADDSVELDELARIAAVRVELADDYAAGKISRDTKNEDAAALDRRQREIETRLAAKVRANADSAPVDFDAESIDGRTWEELDVEVQRRLLARLVDHVTVAPASVIGSTKFEGRRVTAPGQIAWRDAI